jgi:two-component system sensor histidine kinase YesM
MKVSHLLMNEQGDIIYVENNDAPAGIQEIKWKEGSQIQDEYKGYRLFSYKSSQGWQLITAVNKSTFNSEIYLWLKRIVIFAFGTLIFALLLALFIWKQVYRPLRKVNMEIVRMAENREMPVTFTSVEEFDLLLSNFQDMKTEINELIHAVEDNEKQKSRLEIEKLLSQINPHFLHNTLNTVQWLARMNGQKEIDKLVTLLVKVLQYNLGKQSIIVTVQQEIEALKNYMELQRIRYDYEFEFHLHVDDDLLYAAIPRFLLQPLVENAIYHGTSERHGRVDITIRSTGPDMMLLRVEDNGTGIDQQSFEQLLETDELTKRRGLGIGLSYVNRLLKRFYGENVLFRIESLTDARTAVTIEIPKKSKEEFDD